mmetsp:Transcript_5792/g.22091  ORF Transcript_5792/g.22091 Transcript_5792/m.22091 type:complete len:533 (+) Transcript_5792:147-1745(+)
MYDGHPGAGSGYRPIHLQTVTLADHQHGVVYDGGGQAACGPNDCGLLGDACLEPAGQTTELNWKYVGGGRGGYEKLTTMKYVGQGVGGFDKQAEASSSGSRFASCTIVLVVLAIVCGVLYFGMTAFSGSDGGQVAPLVKSMLYTTPPPAVAATAQGAVSITDSPAEFTYDCAVALGGNDDVSSWSMDRRVYCCSKFGVECNAPLPTAVVPWTAQVDAPHIPQAALPVQAAAAAAGAESSEFAVDDFDCRAGLENWERGWSEAKKRSCCNQEGVGCTPTAPLSEEVWVPPPPKATTTTSTSTSTSTLTSTSTSTTTKPAAILQPPKRVEATRQTTSAAAGRPNLYDCEAGIVRWEQGWSVLKKKWCCQEESVACDPFDCDADHDTWNQIWPSNKKKWCCQNKDVGCTPAAQSFVEEAYACHAGLTHWENGWSEGKKQWCCEHEQLGCPASQSLESNTFDCATGVANWQSGWSDEKKAWCCDTQNFGCATTTTQQVAIAVPYECQIGYSNWQDGWSVAKKVWCCENLGRGCVRK